MGIPVRIDTDQLARLVDPMRLILASLSQTPTGKADDPVHVLVDSPELASVIEKVADALSKLTQPPGQSEFRLLGGTFMRTFLADRPDDAVHFKPAVVVDSEGNPVEPQPDLSYQFS